MSLKLMYITNNPAVAQIAESNGVDRIFIDLEYIGKELRQKGMNTVKSHHTMEDVAIMRNAIQKAQLLVRCNPIHQLTDACSDSKEEINEIINRGADYVMLPYFKTLDEVQSFLEAVHGRAKTILLFETPQAVELIDEILELDGISEAFVGLNDLSLGYHKHFMFELLTDGTVESLALKFRRKEIPFGFGGIASVGKGDLPAEKIICEHYRMFSDSVILSRSFCNTDEMTDLREIEQVFARGIAEIRDVEAICREHSTFFKENMKEMKKVIETLK